jgi:hypothetical protein
MKRYVMTGIVAAALLAGSAPAEAFPGLAGGPAVSTPGNIVKVGERGPWRGKLLRKGPSHRYRGLRRGWAYPRRPVAPRYYYYHRHRDRDNDVGVFFGGLALGIIGSQLLNQVPAYSGYAGYYAPPVGSADWIRLCSLKYRTFNPATGLYHAGNGIYRRCRLP